MSPTGKKGINHNYGFRLKPGNFFILILFSNPTPDNITLLEGIPKFLLYSNSDENYMKIGTTWEVKKDFTTTYTITADELKPAAGKYPFQMRSRFNYLSNKQ